MVRIVNITENFNEDDIKNTYYLYSMMPLAINNTNEEGIYYIEFTCNVLSSLSQEYIYLIIGFTFENKTVIQSDNLYIDNILHDNRRKAIYERILKGSNNTNTYQTEFNMTYDNDFYLCGLMNLANKSNSLLKISRNMFLRISLFLDGLLHFSTIPFALFTESIYNFFAQIQYTKGMKLPNNAKIIINGKYAYCIYKDSNLKFIMLSIEDLKSIKGDLKI